jgi:hypothetical protein
VPHLSSAVAAPERLQAVALDSTSARVSWKPFPREPSEVHVFRIDPATQDQQIPVTQGEVEAKGSVTEATVPDLPPDSQVCFQAVTVRGKTQSLRSEPACAQTEAAPDQTTVASGTGSAASGSAGSTTASASETSASDTATGTESGSATGSASGSTATSSSTSSSTSTGGPDFDDDWVLARLEPFTDASSKALAQHYQDQFISLLEALGRDDLAAGQLDSARYPGLHFARRTIVVYVGTFPTKDDAQALCPDLDLVGSLCVALQPGAPT